MNGLNEFAISACSMTLLSFAITWYQNGNESTEKTNIAKTILSSPETSWKKVGSVKEIYCYPLKSGKAKVVEECIFDKNGIRVEEGVSVTKDRMFLAYNEKTGKYLTGYEYPQLFLVKVNPINDRQAKIEVAGMPHLIFDLPKNDDDNKKVVKFTMWHKEITEGIDCGDDVSRWISRFLNGTDNGFRLGYYNPEKQRMIVDERTWQNHAKWYPFLRKEDTGLFAYLMSYMVISEASVNDLNKRMAKSIPPRQLRPNIVVEGCNPFAEDDWEWIRIGDEAIVRNVKPCTRCVMTRIDPDTGIPDPQYEPLKTLRTYRRLKNPELDVAESHAPAIGVYCGLYRTGRVKVGDDIFIYQEDNNTSKS